LYELMNECPECGSVIKKKYDMVNDKYRIECTSIGKKEKEMEKGERKNYAMIKLDAEVCSLIESNYIKEGKCGYAEWDEVERKECPKCGSGVEKMERIEVKANKIVNICGNKAVKKGERVRVVSTPKEGSGGDEEMKRMGVICGFVCEF